MQTKVLSYIEIFIIVGLAIFPTFLTLPFRPYLYLSWEGAYRISEGQLPFKDFGLPLGGLYWFLPAAFMKIFGPQMITLLKFQAFMNIIAGLAFRSILRSQKILPVIRTAAILLFCISYSFQNFWPWYNHSVFVYGFVALAFILKFLNGGPRKYGLVYLLSGAFFTFFAFFTKQDGGGLIFVICLFLLLYNSWLEKRWRAPIIYGGTTILLCTILILIFSQYGFGYWFNHGQQPHNARISFSDLTNEFLGQSQWLKFYFFVILLLVVIQYKEWKTLINDRAFMISLLTTLGILVMAAIIQVTSYVPRYGNLFLHSFAFAFIIQQIMLRAAIKVPQLGVLVILCVGVTLWWSQLPWVYLQRYFNTSVKEGIMARSPDNENMVNMHNAILRPKEEDGEQSKWIKSDLRTLKKMTLPGSTVKGLDRLMKMDLIRNNKNLKVLNMSELTFLAAEIPFQLESNPDAPLWHHLGVGMFNKHLHMYEDRIKNNYYDLVIFEYVPDLNNFFPFATRDSLKALYQQADSFDAPRTGGRPGVIEVFVKKTGR